MRCDIRKGGYEPVFFIFIPWLLLCSVLQSKNKKYETRKSTGQKDRSKALLIVADWIKNCIPENKKSRPITEIKNISSIIHAIKTEPLTLKDTEKIINILKDRNLLQNAILKSDNQVTFIHFLLSFWNYDNSLYVREKKAHNHSIGRRHCYDMSLHVNNHWQPYFKDTLLLEIKKTNLKAFSLYLSEEKQLNPKTINNILGAGTVALNWAFNNEIIPINPASGLVKFSGKHKTRGILTLDETKKLFSIPWDDKRSHLGNMLASVTGLRAGEVLALQVRDIGEDRLFIRHSFSNQDGLKSTKTGKERYVPFRFPVLRKALFTLANQNPHGIGPTSFIFWSFSKPNRPIDFKLLLKGLKKALYKINPSENWKQRNIVFHSWRHFFATNLVNQIEERKAMKATGHTSLSVFQAYADHNSEEVFTEVSEAINIIFSEIIKNPHEKIM